MLYILHALSCVILKQPILEILHSLLFIMYLYGLQFINAPKFKLREFLYSEVYVICWILTKVERVLEESNKLLSPFN